MGGFEVKSVVIDLNQLWDYAVKIPVVLLIVLTGWFLMRYGRRLILASFTRTSLETKLSQMVAGVLSVVGWTIIIATTLSVLGLNELSLVVSGSIALLALGIAQGINGLINDWISGVFLVAETDFQPGRRVKVGTVEGTVVSLGIRKTKILDSRGDLHIIPNRNIDNAAYLVRRQRQGLRKVK